MDYYKILEIPETASKSEIKKAYRKLSKIYLPDVYDGDKDYAEERMKEINIAFDVLYNNNKTFDEINDDNISADSDNGDAFSGRQDSNFTEENKDYNEKTEDHVNEPPPVHTTNKTAYGYDTTKPKWILSMPVIMLSFFIFPPVGQIISVLLFIVRYIKYHNVNKLKNACHIWLGLLMLMIIILNMMNSNNNALYRFKCYLFNWTGLIDEVDQQEQSTSDIENESLSVEKERSSEPTEAPANMNASSGSTSLGANSTNVCTDTTNGNYNNTPVKFSSEEPGILYYDETNDYYYYD